MTLENKEKSEIMNKKIDWKRNERKRGCEGIQNTIME